MMPDPRESAHFAKIAKITSGDSGPCSVQRHLGPSGSQVALCLSPSQTEAVEPVKQRKGL